MLILWGIRFFIFKLYESPKYLMSKGLDERAVEVVHLVAKANGTTSNLKLEDLQRVNGQKPLVEESHAKGAVKRQLAKFESGKVKSLFATRRLALSTSLLIAIWGACSLVHRLLQDAH